MNNTRFPKSFFWGTSTASHQIEGNTLNDWSEWEKTNAERLAKEAPKAFGTRSPVWEKIVAEATDPRNYISGICDDSYSRWQEDIELLKQLGINAYRFSIEWSRIQPSPDQFDEMAITHYKNILSELRKNNIEPFVTVLHRTIPLWFAHGGGWGNRESVQAFASYVKVLAEKFGSEVTFWTVINEPVLNVGGGYVAGNIPPSKKNIITAFAAYRNMIRAHKEAYNAIKQIHPEAHVGSAHAAVYAEAEHGHWYNQLLVNGIHYFANWKFLNGIRKHTDFIGIQYYTRGVIGCRKSKYLIPLPGEIKQPGPASDMGQEIYPEGLYRYTRMVWDRYKLPIIVTENGIADRNDTHRAQYIQDHIAKVEKLLAEGVDMRGYFYWSLLDNFEWDKGFWPRFGLTHVDRNTQARTLRPSSNTYRDIIKSKLPS